jgi:carboxylesterase
MKVVRKDLEDGVKLPTDTYLKVFHSLHDPVASSTSSVIYKGLKRVPEPISMYSWWILTFTFYTIEFAFWYYTFAKGQSVGCFSQIAIKLK